VELSERIKATELTAINYVGPSMNPIFKSGDRLQIASYGLEKIRVGDVVVFISPEDNSKVVHRVVSLNSNGIKTRGDNCDQPDDWVLSPNCILGRVVFAQRGNRRFKVFGGVLGQLSAMAARAIIAIDFRASPLLRPTYHRLANKSIFRGWLPDLMKIRVVSFNRQAGTELQLLMGRHLVGRWLPGMSRWYIRRPFRLFVDETSLPENPGKGSVVPPEANQLSVVDKELLPNKVKDHLKSLPLDGGG
jgi:signal peptidase